MTASRDRNQANPPPRSNPPEHQRITQREDESPIWAVLDPVTSHTIELFDTLSVLAFGV